MEELVPVLMFQHPFVLDGVEHDDLVLTYAENAAHQKYRIRQVETGIVYDSAVDVYPSRYTYEVTDELIPEEAVEEPEANASDAALEESEVAEDAVV